MISKVYISHSPADEDLALQLAAALWRVGLESYAALYNLSPAISLAERANFGLRNSECLVALLTAEGSTSPQVCQEIGLARGLDLLIIPMLGDGTKLPFLHRAPTAPLIPGGEIRRCRRPAHQDFAGAVPFGVAQGGLSQMRGGDDPIPHAPGGGGGGAGEGRVAGDGLLLLPE